MNEFESTFKAFLVLLTLGTPKTMYIMLFKSTNNLHELKMEVKL